MPRRQAATEDDVRYAEQLRAIYDDWERRVFEQGEEKGMEQGMRELLLGTYEACFGTMRAELRAALDATADIATLRRWGALFATAGDGEIAAAVLSDTKR